MFRSTLAAALVAATTLAGAAQAAPLASPTEAGRFALDRSLVLPSPTLTSAGSPIIALGGGIREGGLSALQVVPGTGNRRFVTITDRGPNGQPTQATGGRTFPTPTSRRRSWSCRPTMTAASRSSNACRSASPAPTRCVAAARARSPAIRS